MPNAMDVTCNFWTAWVLALEYRNLAHGIYPGVSICPAHRYFGNTIIRPLNRLNPSPNFAVFQKQPCKAHMSTINTSTRNIIQHTYLEWYKSDNAKVRYAID